MVRGELLAVFLGKPQPPPPRSLDPNPDLPRVFPTHGTIRERVSQTSPTIPARLHVLTHKTQNGTYPRGCRWSWTPRLKASSAGTAALEGSEGPSPPVEMRVAPTPLCSTAERTEAQSPSPAPPSTQQVTHRQLHSP